MRVLIIGNSGSGKSTLAGGLSRRSGVLAVSLDDIPASRKGRIGCCTRRSPVGIGSSKESSGD